VDDHGFLNGLAGVVERLVDRHLESSREWFPHELIPWSRGRDFTAREEWCPAEFPLTEPVRAALAVNLLTEDNLPYYFHAVLETFGRCSPWDEWVRRWTAEEGRHASVIRDYVIVTRALDPIAVERHRMLQTSTGWVAGFRSPIRASVYLTVQERATRIIHRNTGRLIADEAGYQVMARVAADENLHHVFYRDVVTAALALDASTMVQAIDAEVRSFEMVRPEIPGFAALVRTMARAGIYDYAIHLEQVLRPLVLRHWKLDSLEGLDGPAEQARERCLAHLARMGHVASRLQERRDNRLAAIG